MHAEQTEGNVEFSDMRKRAYAIHALYQEIQKSEAGHTWSASDTMLGFVGDVGDLAKLVMAQEGLRSSSQDVQERIRHELSDCLWSVIVLAKQLDIDLEEAFKKTMDQLEEKANR